MAEYAFIRAALLLRRGGRKASQDFLELEVQEELLDTISVSKQAALWLS
jgi:hypothetical protein